MVEAAIKLTSFISAEPTVNYDLPDLAEPVRPRHREEKSGNSRKKPEKNRHFVKQQRSNPCEIPGSVVEHVQCKGNGGNQSGAIA